jgi:hypothetical protein
MSTAACPRCGPQVRLQPHPRPHRQQAPQQPPKQQRGVTTLVVTLVLLLALALLTGQAHRGLMMEQRSSANQLHATQAFEAAEAGLAWAQAQLNHAGGVNSACQPNTRDSAQADNGSFSDRMLSWQAPGQGKPQTQTQTQAPGLHVRTRVEGGTTRPLRAACAAQADGGWRCDCPDQAEPTWPAPADTIARPGFIVQFSDGPVRGTLRLSVTGCHEASTHCSPEQPPAGESRAELSLLLGLVPALLRAPAAPLTTRQDIQAGTAALGLHNTQPQAGGLLAHAGGDIQADGARLDTVAGEPGALALAAHDTTLAALAPDALFITHFGLDRARWVHQPAVRSLPCAVDCSAALSQAVANGDTLIHLQGDAQLQGPLSLGTAERPLLLVVDGSAHLAGGVQLQGLLYAREIQWQTGPGPGPGLVRGALISEGGYGGTGAPDLVWDRAVLDMLRGRWGTWAPVPGGWSDLKGVTP